MLLVCILFAEDLYYGEHNFILLRRLISITARTPVNPYIPTDKPTDLPS